MKMNEENVKHLQKEMNEFVERNKSLGHTKVRVDGDWGRLTKALTRDIKYDLGYLRRNMTPRVGENFFHRMRNPKLVRPEWNQPKSALTRGKKRRAARRRKIRRLKITAFLKPGVGYFDGKPVAKCAIPVLNWCRAHGWHGTLVSGWRDPKYSQGLCIRMCGRPSCPGTCAGMASNHVGNSPARFAMDVSDYINFAQVVARCPIQPKVHNALPNDRVHFSPSGN